MNNCSNADKKQCENCPNRDNCYGNYEDEDINLIKNKLQCFKLILCIMCGKGGVGKSLLSVILAQYFSEKFKTILIDLDLAGSSIPRLTNTTDYFITNVENQFNPIKINELSVVSMGHIHNNISDIYTSEIKRYFIKNILKNCAMDNKEILILDTPPNITEEHFAIYNYICNAKAILISTPHVLCTTELNRQFIFCQKANIDIVGIVSNMDGIRCSKCNHINQLFSKDIILKFCQNKYIQFLGEIEFNSQIVKNIDKGEVIHIPQLKSIYYKLLSIIMEFVPFNKKNDFN